MRIHQARREVVLQIRQRPSPKLLARSGGSRVMSIRIPHHRLIHRLRSLRWHHSQCTTQLPPASRSWTSAEGEAQTLPRPTPSDPKRASPRQRPIPRPLPRRPTRHPNPPQIRQAVLTDPRKLPHPTPSTAPPTPRHATPPTPDTARDLQSLPNTHHLDRAAPYRYVFDSTRCVLCRRPLTVSVLNVLARSPMLRRREIPEIRRSAAPQRQPVPERSS